jgi:nitrate/nitrite transport system substrate-binding protein
LRPLRTLTCAIAALSTLGLALPAPAALLDVEKDELKFGFIKLTDCAALVIEVNNLRDQENLRR